MGNLYQASRQWSTRPADERFSSLEETLEACEHYRQSARTALVDANTLTATANGPEVYIQGKTGTSARLTHWSFGQLARRANAPADYLRQLPAPLAAENLNHGLNKADGQASLLMHKNGDLVLRCLTTEKYARIWNDDVVRRLLDFPQYGWRIPPARPAFPNQPGSRPATEKDVLSSKGHGGLSIRVGDMIAPAGLYASDHDMFAFMINEDRSIQDGTERGLSRGFFLSNSEVGAAALKVTTFLYRHVCGNHIVWGAENAKTLKIVHRGQADRRFQAELIAELRDYSEQSAQTDEIKIRTAQSYKLGNNKEEVLDALFKALRGDLAKKTIADAYDVAEDMSNDDFTINPYTVWGQVQGLTQYSQREPFADERSKIDRAAGKVLEMAF